MRIGVISDTHGKTTPAQALISKAGPLDILIHAGDFLSDLDQLKLQFEDISACYGVAGNCDEFQAPKKLLLEFLGMRLLVVHGHHHGVKQSPIQLKYLAEEEQADVVVYGHSHTPHCESIDGVTYLNPGSASEPRGSTIPTMAVLDMDRNGSFKVGFVTQASISCDVHN